MVCKMAVIVASILVVQFVAASVVTAAPTCEEIDTDVLILGAGMSGISAAKTLYDNGMKDFMVLEATDRIGGRIRDEEFGSVRVETGAYLLQGVPEEDSDRKNFPVWNLFESGTCEKPEGQFADYDSILVYRGSTDVTDEFFGIFDTPYGPANEIITNKSLERQANGQPDLSAREAFEMYTDWNPKSDIEDLVDWYGFDYSFVKPPETVSLFFSRPPLVYQYGDADYLFTGQNGDGFASVVSDCLAKDFISSVKLNTEVTQVSWSDECVCAKTQERDICGRYAIITFSVGVLQEWVKENKFDPSLPQEKVDAINAFDTATYLRMFARFSTNFWDDVEYIHHADEQRGRFPLIEPVGRLLPNMPNIISIAASDPQSISISTQPESQTRAEIIELLEGIYGAENVSTLEDLLIPDWYTNPYYRGAYSSTPPGVGGKERTMLGRPEGRLYFSGEAVISGFTQVVQGAYLAGIDTANEILSASAGQVLLVPLYCLLLLAAMATFL